MARCAICRRFGLWRLAFGWLVGFGFGLGGEREAGFQGESWSDFNICFRAFAWSLGWRLNLFPFIIIIICIAWYSIAFVWSLPSVQASFTCSPITTLTIAISCGLPDRLTVHPSSYDANIVLRHIHTSLSARVCLKEDTNYTSTSKISSDKTYISNAPCKAPMPRTSTPSM